LSLSGKVAYSQRRDYLREKTLETLYPQIEAEWRIINKLSLLYSYRWEICLEEEARRRSRVHELSFQYHLTEYLQLSARVKYWLNRFPDYETLEGSVSGEMRF
jgi:hypothetical protein